jgi:hypothetical protein
MRNNVGLEKRRHVNPRGNGDEREDKSLYQKHGSSMTRTSITEKQGELDDT